MRCYGCCGLISGGHVCGSGLDIQCCGVSMLECRAAGRVISEEDGDKPLMPSSTMLECVLGLRLGGC